MIIGRIALIGALEKIGIGGHSAATVASALVYVQLDRELSMQAAQTEVEILEFIDDVDMLGMHDIEPFGLIDKLRAHLTALREFFGPDEGQARKIAAGIHELDRACGYAF